MIRPTVAYLPRIIEQELDDLAQLPALAIEGAKGVGKTATASRRANTVYRLDDPDELDIALGDPRRLLSGASPVLIDEWQRVPPAWDLVRRAVDGGAPGGAYLLTGSASRTDVATHSGAGRIVSLRMRPMSLAERTDDVTTVSLAGLLTGARTTVEGRTDRELGWYVDEILMSGLPGVRGYDERPRRAQLDSYVARVVSRDFPDLGHPLRSPETFERWLRAYAAATSTTATYETIRDAATSGQTEKPAKTTAIGYRDVLTRLWLLDPVSAWLPVRNRFHQLASPPKHHLADPALAARLLGATAGTLLKGGGSAPGGPRDGTLLGALFESLVTLSVRTYAQAAGARVRHLRTKRGEHEIDLIVERDDGRVVALEVKMVRNVRPADVTHLNWLASRIGDDLIDRVIITTGPEAYRRQDGVAVVPAALLGP